MNEGEAKLLKVCLYLEAKDTDLVSKSGFKTAFRNHKRALELSSVEVVTDPTADYDILHLHGYGPRSLYYLKKAKHDGKKVIVHAHSTGRYDLKNSFTLTDFLSPLHERYLNYFYSQSDCIFTPSAHARALLRAHGIKKPIALVSNGVDRGKRRFSAEKRHEYRKALRLSRFTVLSAGNVIPRKGIVEFIEVAEKLPEFDFIWYGQRWNSLLSFYPKMHRRIKSRPKNMEFPGFIEDIQGAFCAGDLFFFPSYGENQPLVLLEAAAIGLPMVVRDLPEYQGWLKEEENCLKGEDKDEFVAQIKRLAETPELREKLSQGALKTSEEHSLEKVGERLRKLYASVLSGKIQRERESESGLISKG